jgi:hypothetical protein
MMLFSPDFMARFNNAGALKAIEERLPKLAALRVDQSDGFKLSAVSKIPAKVAVLMQAGLRRTSELSEAAVDQMKAQRIVNMVVLVRAAFETACLLYDVVLKCEKVVEKNDIQELDKFNTYVSNILLGHGPKAKTFVLAEEYVVQNILTVIQRLSKELHAPFEGFYQ